MISAFFPALELRAIENACTFNWLVQLFMRQQPLIFLDGLHLNSQNCIHVQVYVCLVKPSWDRNASAVFSRLLHLFVECPEFSFV